jgi:hypothetical protein
MEFALAKLLPSHFWWQKCIWYELWCEIPWWNSLVLMLMISKNVFRCLIQLFVALMSSAKLSNSFLNVHKGSNFQSLLCCFFSTRRLIFSLLFPILFAQGLKFEITSMLCNVTLDPITKQKNTQNQLENGWPLKCPISKFDYSTPMPNILSLKTDAKLKISKHKDFWPNIHSWVAFWMVINIE